MTFTRPRRIKRSSTSVVSEQERLARKREQNRIAQQTYRRAQKERIQALEAAVARSAPVDGSSRTQSEDVFGNGLLFINDSAETATSTSATTSASSSNSNHTLSQPLLDLDLDPRLSQSFVNGGASCLENIFGGYAFQSSNMTPPTVAAAPANHGKENHQAESSPAQTEDISNLDASPAFEDAEATAWSSEGIEEASVWSHSVDNYTTHTGGNKSDETSLLPYSGMSPLPSSATYYDTVHSSRPSATPRNHNISRSTGLHIAALAGDSRMVELLLDRGADAGLLNKDGQSPLHLAVMAAAEVEQGLRDHHSCANQGNNNGGDTKAREAEKTVRLLLRALGAGANNNRHPGTLDKSGRPVLFTAITTGSEAIVQMVLDAIGDESIAKGRSILDSSSNRVNSDIRQAGIKAALEEPDARGTLPLHLAVASRSASMVLLLLSNGANINQ